MLRLAVAIEPAIRTALSPMPGGHYRTEDPDGNASVPSWWLHADNSASLNTVQDATLVTLDIWHVSLGDLEDALTRVEFLRSHDEPGISYERQSVAVIHEGQNVHHASVFLSAVHFAGV